MFPRLKIKLCNGWSPVENGAGPATYVKGDSCIHFSQTKYKGDLSQVDAQKHIDICEGLTRKIRGRRDLMSGSGGCKLGQFGTVVAKGDEPAYTQVWVLSKGNDFVLITHICNHEPSQAEVDEARVIALGTTLGPPETAGSKPSVP